MVTRARHSPSRTECSAGGSPSMRTTISVMDLGAAPMGRPRECERTTEPSDRRGGTMAPRSPSCVASCVYESAKKVRRPASLPTAFSGAASRGLINSIKAGMSGTQIQARNAPSSSTKLRSGGSTGISMITPSPVSWSDAARFSASAPADHVARNRVRAKPGRPT